MNEQLLKEVKTAYADCWMNQERLANRTRQLSFRALDCVSPQEAMEIMQKVMGGYNDFAPKLLLQFPENAKILIAREGSVCMYVKGEKLPSMRKTKANEKDTVTIGGEKWERYWWD